VEIICVGNELLIGKTLNTNSQWLAKRITTLGLSVTRITVIGDEVKSISRTIRKALARKPSYVITTGGLGPTFDDKTLEGISEALNSRLVINQNALKMVKEKYAKYAREMAHSKFELTSARVKMARIPKEAEPISNPVGTAPAILVTKNNSTIIALPGVPSEMKAIFEESLSPMLKTSSDKTTFFEASLNISGIMESELAPLLDQVMCENPRVYIKSHPKGTEAKPRIELHLSTTSEAVDTAKKNIAKTLVQLTELIEAKGGSTQPRKNKL
jgi:molybdenum cofactor synthesis domain-containing protein